MYAIVQSAEMVYAHLFHRGVIGRRTHFYSGIRTHALPCERDAFRRTLMSPLLFEPDLNSTW